MTKTIIIGFGNTLRGDDGAGVAAAEMLAGDFPGANVVAVQELHPELAEQLASCDLAVFLDASVRTSTLCVTRVSPARSVHGAEGHAFSPPGSLRSAPVCTDMPRRKHSSWRFPRPNAGSAKQ